MAHPRLSDPDEATERTRLVDFQSVTDELPDKDAQPGVQEIEAITTVWSRSNLILAYVMIFVILFVNALQEQVANQLVSYVYSDFSLATLTSVTSVLSSIVGALAKLPIAKILDVCGRSQGFALMVFCCTIGLIMMAGCRNVETYCAAQVFYWLGYDGILYVIHVWIADTSSLKNRALMFAFSTSPYLATTWIGGPVASSFLYGPGWRWAYGTFSLVLPVTCVPLIILFEHNYRKAKELGLIAESDNDRTFLQSLKYYSIEFDLIGIIILASGLAIFFLPFSLYSYQSNGWHSAMIVCMIVFGIFLLVAFTLYEKFLAVNTFIPFELLMDRTVMGSCILAAVSFVSFYCWSSYFSNYLQVVHAQTVTHASYIGNIYTLGTCFWGLVVGVLISLSGRFKWLSLYVGVPIQILGLGLMIYFREPGRDLSYVIMCQLLIALGGGTTVICQQMAVMAASDHEHLAVVLAIQAMFSNIGGAIGSSVSTAIWTGTFPPALHRYLPAELKSESEAIANSLTTQLSYPVGSAVRNAIELAYGVGEKYMLIAATMVWILGLGATAVWRDIKVKDFKQTKGTVV